MRSATKRKYQPILSEVELAEIALLKKDIIEISERFHMGLADLLSAFGFPIAIKDLLFNNLSRYFGIDLFWSMKLQMAFIASDLDNGVQSEVLKWMMKICSEIHKETRYGKLMDEETLVSISGSAAKTIASFFDKDDYRKSMRLLLCSYTTGFDHANKEQYLKWIFANKEFVLPGIAFAFYGDRLIDFRFLFASGLGLALSRILRRYWLSYRPLGVLANFIPEAQYKTIFLNANYVPDKKTYQSLVSIHETVSYASNQSNFILNVFLIGHLGLFIKNMVEISQDEDYRGFYQSPLFYYGIWTLILLKFIYRVVNDYRIERKEVQFTKNQHSLLNKIAKNLNLEDWIFHTSKINFKPLFFSLKIEQNKFSSKKHIYLALRFALLKHGIKILACDRDRILISAEVRFTQENIDQIIADCKIYFNRVKQKQLFQKQLAEFASLLRTRWIAEEVEDENKIPNFDFYISISSEYEEFIVEINKMFGERLEIVRENDGILLVIRGVEPVNIAQIDNLRKLMAKPALFNHEDTQSVSKPAIVEYKDTETLFKPIKRMKIEKAIDKRETIEKKAAHEPINFVKLFNLSGNPASQQIVTLGQNHFAQWCLQEQDFNDKQKYIKFFNIFEKGKRVGPKNENGFVRSTLQTTHKRDGVKLHYGLFKIKSTTEDMRIYEAETIRSGNAVLHRFGKVVLRNHRKQ